jgi:hypothetical protein
MITREREREEKKCEDNNRPTVAFVVRLDSTDA